MSKSGRPLCGPSSGEEFPEDELVECVMDPAKFKEKYPERYDAIHLAMNPLSPSANLTLSSKMQLIALGFGKSLLDVLGEAEGEPPSDHNSNDEWSTL